MILAIVIYYYVDDLLLNTVPVIENTITVLPRLSLKNFMDLLKE